MSQRTSQYTGEGQVILYRQLRVISPVSTEPTVSGMVKMLITGTEVSQTHTQVQHKKISTPRRKSHRSLFHFFIVDRMPQSLHCISNHPAFISIKAPLSRLIRQMTFDLPYFCPARI